jgi:DNA-binding MarR family transcriptional regulator
MKNNTTTAKQLGEMLAIARAYKLSGSALQFLCRIAAEHSLTLGSLCREIGLTSEAATGIADSLVALGFATRMNGFSDRRTVWLDITPRGREALADILNPQAVPA